MRIESEQVTIPVGGLAMGGYLARAVPDEPRPLPAVLVFMEIFGVNAHIRSVCDRIAAEGYVVLAPDYFHRTAPGLDNGYDEAAMTRGMELLQSLRASEVLADAQAAIDYLKTRAEVRSERFGAIGFCIGGHIAYLVASTDLISATASFYGGGIAVRGLGEAAPTLARTGSIRGKLLLFFGAQDTMIPQREVDLLREALYRESIRNELFVYPDAGHGFFCEARSSYHKLGHDDAWRRVKKLFLDELHRT